MIKRFKSVLISSLLLINGLSYAKTGYFFDIIQSGNQATATVELCLNGKAPLSCQKYSINSQNLAIKTTINRQYPFAGIKALTAGYQFLGCTYYAPTGYCLFNASTTPSNIQMNNGSVQPTVFSLSATEITVPAGQMSPTITLTNTSNQTVSNVSINSSVSLTITNSNCNTTLLPQMSCQFNVATSTAGNGSVTVMGSGVNSVVLSVMVTPSPMADLSASPNPLPFTANSTGTFTVTNNSSVTATGIQIIPTGTITIVQGAGTTCGSSLTGNNTCTIEVASSTVGNNNSVTISSSNSSPLVVNVDVLAQPTTTLSFAATGTIPVSTGGVTTQAFTITNNGNAPAAHVRINLPTAWQSSVSQSGCDYVSNEQPNNTCDLMLSSTTPFVAQAGITITGDNISSTTPTNVAIAFTLQGYLIWAIDSSTQVEVIDTTDISDSASWDNSSSPQCTGATSLDNGASNTQLISSAGLSASSAAILCYQSTRGNATAGDWYLPAICQMVSPGRSLTCQAQYNIDQYLNRLGFGGLNGIHWSSTESSDFCTGAYGADFEIPRIGTDDFQAYKRYQYKVRCARSMNI